MLIIFRAGLLLLYKNMFICDSLESSLIYSALHQTNKSFTYHHILILYGYANNLCKSNLKGIK